MYVYLYNNYITYVCDFVGHCLAMDYRFLLATPIDDTYQCHVLFPLCVLDLEIGKGRRLIKSISMHSTSDTTLHTQNTRLSAPHCCYNGNVAMMCMWGMCSREL